MISTTSPSSLSAQGDGVRQCELDQMKTWFAAFCKDHSLADPAEQANLDLKELHTRNVCENMLAIGASIGLSHEEAMIAEAIALFHDVGRFPQYIKYKTFRDDRSENHALLSIAVLAEHDVLTPLPKEEQELITAAIRFHNAFTIPDLPDEKTVLYLKMVRDADKIDILRVFIDADESGERASAIDLGLEETDTYSDEALRCIAARKIFTLKQLRSIHDFRLLQLSWIFDLNFAESLRIMKTRDYPRRIAVHLPRTREIDAAVDSVLSYMEERITNG